MLQNLKHLMVAVFFFGALLALQTAQAAMPLFFHPGDLNRAGNGDWQWHDEWQNYENTLQSQNEYYWLKLRTPEKMLSHEALFFTTRNHEVEVYLDGALIYSYGELRRKNDLLGSTWHMVCLPDDAGAKDLFIRVYGNYQRDRMMLNELEIAPEREHYMRLIRHNLDYFFSASLGAAMFALMLSSWLIAGEVIYLRTAFFFFFFALWTIGESGFSILIWNDPPAWMRLVLYCAYILPIVFASMMNDFISPRCRKQALYLRRALVCVATLTALIDVFHAGFLRDALDVYFLLAGVGILIWLLSLVQLMRAGNHEARWVLLGLTLMPVLSAYDMAGVHWRIVPWTHHLTHLGGVVLAVMLSVVFSRRVAERHRLKELNDLLVKKVKTATHLSLTDPLTGLFNRAKFSQALEAVKHSRRAALIMFDVDHFKNVNDAYGHDAGDRVLVELARTVSAAVGESCLLARLGGEEFAVLCKNFAIEDAVKLAERLRSTIEERFTDCAQPVTCSFGVSSWRQGDSPERFTKRADQALYEAKEQGRNCICVEKQEVLREKSS